MKSRLISLLLALVFVAGCGGGGGNSNPVPVSPPVVIVPATPIQAFSTSYQNAKGYGLSRINLSNSSAAWGAGDFFQRGNIDIFTANLNYSPGTQPFSVANSDPAFLSDFQFWNRNVDGSLTLVSSTKGCMHPRKGVVADFNHDGVPDVFVVCHGYDALVNGKNPGEKSKLVLSNGKGGFTVTDATTEVGFYHGASAADVNGDGWPDIVVADVFVAPNVYFLINNKDGTFTKDMTRITNLGKGPFFSVELIDANGDGIVDLFAGGHEYDPNCKCINAQTMILYGATSGTFGVTNKAIPPVAGRGVVLDFTLVTTSNSQKVLYVGRTADGSDSFSFYATRTLQAVNLDTNISSILLDIHDTWIVWWLPITRNGQLGVAPYNIGQPDMFYSMI